MKSDSGWGEWGRLWEKRKKEKEKERENCFHGPGCLFFLPGDMKDRLHSFEAPYGDKALWKTSKTLSIKSTCSVFMHN